MLKDTLRERFAEKSVTLLGAGVSNMPLVGFFTSLGAHVTVRDKKTKEQLGSAYPEITGAGGAYIGGSGYLDGIDGDYIVRSPGFRPDMSALEDAVSRGSVLTGEMDLFLEYCPCPVIAVTGSDGKSTTTTLIYEILKKSGKKAHLGGNIGEPLFHRVLDINEDDIVSAEISSFQLMTVTSHVDTAVITNISPNHLNWHTGMDEYTAAKKRLLRCRRAVLNYGCVTTRSFADETSADIVFFSAHDIPRDAYEKKHSAVYLKSGGIYYYDCGADEDTFVMDSSDILLPGTHNIENYMAATAAVWGRASKEAIDATARNFGGVKHRLEFVRDFRNVAYYNSSIDSSPTRTAAALNALENKSLVVICGGCDKNIPYEPLADALAAHGNIRAVVLTGATAGKIAAAIDKTAHVYKVITEPDFDKSVLSAAALAVSGDCVLLSPASASFDAFENFEKRGERFKEIVSSLENQPNSEK